MVPAEKRLLGEMNTVLAEDNHSLEAAAQGRQCTSGWVAGSLAAQACARSSAWSPSVDVCLGVVSSGDGTAAAA